MVRSQQGTWFMAGHFKSFFIGQKTDEENLDEWCVYGNATEDFVELGVFVSEKLAQEELDRLFSPHEANSGNSDEAHVRGKHAPALEKKASKSEKAEKCCKARLDEHKASILASMQDHTNQVGAESP